MLCVVVRARFSYLTGKKVDFGPAHLSALITKNASLNAPNVKGCPKLLSSVELGHFFYILARGKLGSARNGEKACYFLPR